MPYQPPRAPRYVIDLPMRFRQRADPAWRRGHTKDVSSSGVLFVADADDPTLDVNTPLEMNLVMPQEIVGAEAARVECHGRVVRTLPPRTADERPGAAATIARYRIVRGDPG